MKKKVIIVSLIIVILLAGIFTGYQAYYNMPEEWMTLLNSNTQIF